MGANTTGLTTEMIVEFYQQTGNISQTARALGTSRGNVYHHLQKVGALGKPLVGGQAAPTKHEVRPLPKKGKVARYILTCAQNNTKVRKPVWDNLLALAEYYEAEIHVSRFSYNKNAYGTLAVKPGTVDTQADLWYDPEIEKYVSDARLELAPGLVWCGEMNIIPTAKRPLSDLETHTGRQSGIFPHVKIALASVASGKFEATKFNYTTGTVTELNYIQKKAGLKAEHHHCYGALLVEVDSDGRWWCRQLNADGNAVIYDLEVHVDGGEVYENDHVEAINWGDIHRLRMNEMVKELAWDAEDSMIDVLKPKYQFMHDTVDFRPRNHHEIKNPHKQFEKYFEGEDIVEDEFKLVTEFLNKESHRDFCTTVVVDSNHDNALERWLREADYKVDPPNAIFFLRTQLKKYEAIARQDPNHHLVEEVLTELGTRKEVIFLRTDESFIICKDAHGGIECGMHGDLGPNGSRGSPQSLSKMGRKANTGHTHDCCIIDGMYVAGTSSELDMGFNKGPSSWSHSHIVTYPNGKRAIITMWNWAWRAAP